MYNRGSYGYGSMPLPARRTSADIKTPPLSPTRSPTAAASPGSPPRKVVTDFAAFGAPANASVFGTKVASTPFSLAGGKAAFGGIRNVGRGAFDEDEEEDDGRQRIDLREGSVSLDQVSVFSVFATLTETWLSGSTNRNAKCMAVSTRLTFCFDFHDTNLAFSSKSGSLSPFSIASQIIRISQGSIRIRSNEHKMHIVKALLGNVTIYTCF